MELAETAKQAAWLRSFSQEIGRSPTHPTTICADNIQEQVKDQRVMICHIPGEDNPADLFTKPLGRIKVEKFKESIGLV